MKVRDQDAQRFMWNELLFDHLIQAVVEQFREHPCASRKMRLHVREEDYEQEKHLRALVIDAALFFFMHIAPLIQDEDFTDLMENDGLLAMCYEEGGFEGSAHTIQMLLDLHLRLRDVVFKKEREDAE